MLSRFFVFVFWKFDYNVSQCGSLELILLEFHKPFACLCSFLSKFGNSLQPDGEGVATVGKGAKPMAVPWSAYLWWKASISDQNTDWWYLEDGVLFASQTPAGCFRNRCTAAWPIAEGWRMGGHYYTKSWNWLEITIYSISLPPGCCEPSRESRVPKELSDRFC